MDWDNIHDAIDWDNIHDAPDFSSCLEGQSVTAKVVSVYDGDSIKAIFPFKDTLLKWTCRIDGVDTPEVRTRNADEKKYGIFVRDKLRDLILNKVVTLKCGELDKYGRLLVQIFVDGLDTSISEWLIFNRYAYQYDGGTKQSWENFDYNYSD